MPWCLLSFLTLVDSALLQLTPSLLLSLSPLHRTALFNPAPGPESAVPNTLTAGGWEADCVL